MAEHQLAVRILLALDVDLDFVAGLQVGIVTKLTGGDDTVALGSDVDDGLAVVDGNDGALDHLLLGEGVERFFVGFGFVVGLFLFDFTGFLFDCAPIKIGQRLDILIIHSFLLRRVSSALFMCILSLHGFIIINSII